MFDIYGRHVRTLMETQVLSAGEHEVAIDGRGKLGEVLPSAVYFYKVDTPDGIVTGCFAILRQFDTSSSPRSVPNTGKDRSTSRSII